MLFLVKVKRHHELSKSGGHALAFDRYQDFHERTVNRDCTIRKRFNHEVNMILELLKLTVNADKTMVTDPIVICMEPAPGNEIQRKMTWSCLEQVSENKDYLEERQRLS